MKKKQRKHHIPAGQYLDGGDVPKHFVPAASLYSVKDKNYRRLREGWRYGSLSKDSCCKVWDGYSPKASAPLWVDAAAAKDYIEKLDSFHLDPVGVVTPNEEAGIRTELSGLRNDIQQVRVLVDEILNHLTSTNENKDAQS